MSGFKYKTIYDIDRMRNEYMKYLNLQSQIDDLNFQANKTYLQTKQLPPASGIPDTRSPEEKLKDILFVKQSIKSDLTKIYDPQTVERIIQLVESSPLNGDGGLMRFLANRGQAYIRDLLTKYKIGLGGEQDAKVFVKYLEGYYRDRAADQQALSSAPVSIPTKEYMDKFVRETGISIEYPNLLSESELNMLYSLQNNPELFSIQDGGGQLGGINIVDIDILLSEFNDYIGYITSELPTIATLDKLKEDFLNNPNNNEEIEERIINITGGFRNIPNIRQFLSAQWIQKLFGRTPLPKQRRGRGFGEVDKFESMNEQPSSYIPTLRELKVLDPPDVIKLYKIVKKIGKIDNIKFPKLSRTLTLDQKKEKIIEIIQENREKLEMLSPKDEEEEEFEGHISFGGRLKGCGLKRKSFMVDVDTTKGVKRSPHYVPFGDYFINTKRLNGNGIVTLRTKTGGRLPLKAQVITPTLKNVFNSIIGGKVPTFEDIQKLSDDEKNYLYQISKKANIMDKLSVPAPDKTKIDKDIHRFEVLKGQIMAGNDNKELVKEFKLLINRLVKMNLLPQSQVKDILIELIDLGY